MFCGWMCRQLVLPFSLDMTEDGRQLSLSCYQLVLSCIYLFCALAFSFICSLEMKIFSCSSQGYGLQNSCSAAATLFKENVVLNWCRKLSQLPHLESWTTDNGSCTFLPHHPSISDGDFFAPTYQCPKLTVYRAASTTRVPV